MGANSAEFQRELLQTIASFNGDKEFSVTSQVEPLLDGPAFTVSLKFEDMDTEPLYADLVEYASKYNVDPVLELLITLPHEFPAAPPVFRLLHPVLVAGTGNVLNGNFVVPQLFAEGWNSETSLHTVLEAIKTTLINHHARIDTSSFAFYNFQAFKASAARLGLRPNLRWQHPKAFSKEYHAYSSKFALEVMGLDLPDGFESGNKILMPPVSLQEMTTGPLLHSSSAAHAFVDDSAMVFQLVSAWKFPTFVGVHGFLCPHPDVIIVPQQVMSNMFVIDGTLVNLTRVKLPPLESVVVQPHTVNFAASEAFTGKAPKEFLESSFMRYASVQPGEVISCDAGTEFGVSKDFTFNVVSVKPEDSPAAALWAGFSSHVSIDFLPAMDEFPIPKKRPVVPGAALGNSVGVLQPDLAAQIFGESVPESMSYTHTQPVASSAALAYPLGPLDSSYAHITPPSTAASSSSVRPPAQAPESPFRHGTSANSGIAPAFVPQHVPPTSGDDAAGIVPMPPDPAERRRLAAEAARRRVQAPNSMTDV